MVVNNYQTILIIELNDQMCYSEHHLMVPEHFYCWVAGSFKDKNICRKMRESVTKTLEFKNHVDRSRKRSGRNESDN